MVMRVVGSLSSIRFMRSTAFGSFSFSSDKCRNPNRILIRQNDYVFLSGYFKRLKIATIFKLLHTCSVEGEQDRKDVGHWKANMRRRYPTKRPAQEFNQNPPNLRPKCSSIFCFVLFLHRKPEIDPLISVRTRALSNRLELCGFL